jgi:hypothetical protein
MREGGHNSWLGEHRQGPCRARRGGRMKSGIQGPGKQGLAGFAPDSVRGGNRAVQFLHPVSAGRSPEVGLGELIVHLCEPSGKDPPCPKSRFFHGLRHRGGIFATLPHTGFGKLAPGPPHASPGRQNQTPTNGLPNRPGGASSIALDRAAPNAIFPPSTHSTRG